MKLEKMNQVSVTEFMSKSKEEMYDMAVEMVEKYNRLVDICNDSAKRIADLVIERDNLVERHKVYTSALNKDLADKAAVNMSLTYKIELLEKEIEGRKEVYTALKELMDTEYISIDEHNKINKSYEEKIRHQKENLDGINKTLEIRTKEKESLVEVKNNLNKEIEAHESENARLTERIIGLKEKVKKRDKCIMEKNESINTGNEAIVNIRKQIGEHEEENKRLSEKIMKLHGTITELSHDIDNYKSWNASLHKDIKELKKNKEDDHGKSGFEEYIKYIISEEEGKFKEELNRKFSEEVSKISQKRTEEELAKVKGVGRTSSGRYPWGAKVNDIPCGEDAIE